MAIVWSYTKSTNISVVTGGTSGTPATFATAVTADRAGTVTLKAAAAPSLTFTLTYQITPANVLALIISFVIAAKTAQTDYIGITGTDAWDAAQTEVINVSAGNGTYVSTKRFRTITNICCTDSATGAGGTVWADGTLAVTQPQWGVFWDYSAVAAYRQDCKIDIGDGSTATYFGESDKVILLGSGICSGAWQSVYTVTANATFALGTLIDETKRLVSNPCVISNIVAPYTGYIIYDSASPTYLYGTVILCNKTNYSLSFIRGESRVWHTLHSYDALLGFSSDTDAFGMKIFAAGYSINSTECDNMADVISIGDNSGWSPALYLYSTGTIGISNVSLYGHSHVFLISGAGVTGTFNLANITNYPKALAVGEFQDLWLGDGTEGYEYATGGHYHLGVVGNMVQFAWDATAATVQTGLESVFGVGMVTVTDYDYPGYPDAWALGIQFDPSIGDSNLVADTTALTGGGWYGLETWSWGSYLPPNSWTVYFDPAASATVNRYNTFDLNVCDGNGIPMSGAAVDAKDENDDFCWAEGTVTTDADGQITQQSILYEVYTAGAAAGTPTIVRHSPHKFIISKAGYKTLVKNNISMSEAVNWHVELQPNESHAQSRIVSIGVM